MWPKMSLIKDLSWGVCEVAIAAGVSVVIILGSITFLSKYEHPYFNRYYINRLPSYGNNTRWMFQYH